jgi:glycosyltransferase involved in cell wall biosynthesis
MRHAIFDAPLRARLIARGLERAADFGWEKCASEVLALFDRLERR